MRFQPIALVVLLAGSATPLPTPDYASGPPAYVDVVSTMNPYHSLDARGDVNPVTVTFQSVLAAFRLATYCQAQLQRLSAIESATVNESLESRKKSIEGDLSAIEKVFDKEPRHNKISTDEWNKMRTKYLTEAMAIARKARTSQEAYQNIKDDNPTDQSANSKKGRECVNSVKQIALDMRKLRERAENLALHGPKPPLQPPPRAGGASGGARPPAAAPAPPAAPKNDKGKGKANPPAKPAPPPVPPKSDKVQKAAAQLKDKKKKD